MSQINYEALDPGIRELVRHLNHHGIETTDSGDGSKASWMEGAMDFPHVLVMLDLRRWSVCGGCEYIEEALRVNDEWDDFSIQAMYSPREGHHCPVLISKVQDPEGYDDKPGDGTTYLRPFTLENYKAKGVEEFNVPGMYSLLWNDLKVVYGGGSDLRNLHHAIRSLNDKVEIIRSETGALENEKS